jgi:hypothetical protein
MGYAENDARLDELAKNLILHQLADFSNFPEAVATHVIRINRKFIPA